MKWTSVICTIFFALVCWIPYESQGASRKLVNSELGKISDKQNSVGISEHENIIPVNGGRAKIGIIYDSSGMDKEFQMESLQTVFVALRTLDENEEDLKPYFIDISKVSTKSFSSNLATVAEWIRKNYTSTVVSLINPRHLQQFSGYYEQLVRSDKSEFTPELKIFTPRLLEDVEYPPSVSVYSLQMNERALSVALLNRVEKVGIRTLIPILDSNSPSQIELLNQFIGTGLQRLKAIQFTRPIFMDNPSHIASFRDILDQHTGFSTDKLTEHSKSGVNNLESKFLTNSSAIGVMMLASQGSQKAMKIAAEKRHMQVGWFSPNILQHEEWAYRASATKDEESAQPKDITDADADQITTFSLNGNETLADGNWTSSYNINPHFGLYTVNFVGSTGWDNPTRRRVLRELTEFTGASPRILTAVLAYDSAWVAVNNVRNQLHFPMAGLSGEIAFDSDGYRREGVFFGVSAVPDLASPNVTLLQPSTWILEDTITIMETLEGQFLITSYEVATSSILTGHELLSLANQTRKDAGCVEHIMNLITHDPFNQMPYNYFFKETSLPESLLIPNQHGFGITFLCIHGPDDRNKSSINDIPQNHTEAFQQQYENDTLTTTLQIACTPGMKISEPIKCFRSAFKMRQRRSSGNKPVPEVQYQYGLSGTDDWNLPQNSKWSNPKEDYSNNYYYQPPSFYYPSAVTQSSAIRRADSSLAASAETPASTPAPAPAPTSSLPELRQILKAAKPFVGSCIGSTTGCAMCVLVLGRLPLGAVPAACTGPCFVGTFGSCGSLLGRVFSETTIVCSELFRQGLMDTETFVADAEFGRMMQQQFPTALQGYQLLATPVVDAMKKSAMVTNIVSTFALPWAHHMKFLMGRTNKPNIPGLIIHTIGFPFCNIAGQFYSFYTNHFSFVHISFLIATLLFVFAITLFNNSIRRLNTKQSPTDFTHLRVVLERSQELIRHLFT